MRRPILKCDLRPDDRAANMDPKKGEIWQDTHVGRENRAECRASICAGIMVLAIARIEGGKVRRKRGDKAGQIAAIREALDLEKIAANIARARMQ